MTNNALKKQRNESLEQYIMRVRAMSSDEINEAAELQRQKKLAEYRDNSKESNYKRKVYHKQTFRTH